MMKKQKRNKQKSYKLTKRVNIFWLFTSILYEIEKEVNNNLIRLFLLYICL